ncbi:hypothetical protein AVEN_262500-1 [Araneus ventricosus]|uniref:Uncharacterized protein n=1 Tax=Araneus ventricosus TaxID=182803 RepID=A0A4Y2SY43_ARAVE|nr:hypothetical protein AVEN_262500-1 [Araneus ventricosus]
MNGSGNHRHKGENRTQDNNTGKEEKDKRKKRRWNVKETQQVVGKKDFYGFSEENAGIGVDEDFSNPGEEVKIKLQTKGKSEPRCSVVYHD